MTESLNWLEEVQGEKPLAWARTQNEICEGELQVGSNEFKTLQEEIKAILDSDTKIPQVYRIADQQGLFYNLWKDKTHELGIWRRTTLEQYRRQNECQWETVLDLDELSKKEGVRWTWGGATDCVSEVEQQLGSRCLISLSRGGSDATITREFDVVKKCFISAQENGFEKPEAKGALSWIDFNHVLIHTDFGDGKSMTKSGYARTVRLWKRGTKLSESKLIHECNEDDLVLSASHDPTFGFERDVFVRAMSFYSDQMWIVNGKLGILENGSKLQLIEDIPQDSKKSLHRDWLLLELRSDWNGFPAGSLITTKLNDWISGNDKREKSVWKALFVPTEHSFLDGYCRTLSRLVLTVLDDVRTKIYIATPPNLAASQNSSEWEVKKFETTKYNLPDNATLYVRSLDEVRSEEIFVTALSYLVPPSLFYGILESNDGCKMELMRVMPEMFNSNGLIVEQFKAISNDGTSVPYTVIHKEGIPLNANHPTLLYAYGGFEISLLPSYNASVGKAWLTSGGIYVEANIRGGGEFGPNWHKSALKKNRIKAYEDFASVAKDLFKRGFTCPSKLGIKGGSNGGLLVLNSVLLYPELFGAVVSNVPLADMKRYSHLLAGHSWMEEYGDPDTDDWLNFLKDYSPLHNIPKRNDNSNDKSKKLPPILITTSTRDDRVHPAHARKMVFALKESGFGDCLYFENIEGGHGGSVNNAQASKLSALSFSFLKKHLF